MPQQEGTPREEQEQNEEAGGRSRSAFPLVAPERAGAPVVSIQAPGSRGSPVHPPHLRHAGYARACECGAPEDDGQRLRARDGVIFRLR